MCLHKKCEGVCLHKRHEYIDITTISSPFGIYLCCICWGYKLGHNEFGE